MHRYLYHALGSFRSLFSHHRTWLKFAMIVLGFIASTEMVGVSSWCRLWSKKMPRHSRAPKTNRALTAPAAANLGKVQQCSEAYERFVMLGAIALGLLQLIALRFTASIWQQHRGFLRTRSRTLPSERTVKQVVMPLVVRDFLNPACNGIIGEIRTHYSKEPSLQQAPHSSPDSEYLAA